jgi:hypothetical protein
MTRLRTRILPVLGLAAGAPVCAEYLQAYLPTTGELWSQLAGLLVLGPLYGGAALLIREAAIRTGRGWAGILLMATAFGLLMTGTVDLSLWLEDDPSVPYWQDLRTATLLQPLGFAVHPLLSWVCGHVLFSIAAPLAVLDALAPAHRGRPLLGKIGITITAILALTAATLIHRDQQQAFDLHPSALQQAAVGIAALTLVVLALSPLGRPVPRQHNGGAPSLPAVAVAGLLVGLAVDLLPMTWTWTIIYAAIVAAAATAVRRVATRATWGLRHTTALATGALTARVLIGFLSPLPPGVSLGVKLFQSATLMLLVIALSALAWRRAHQSVTDTRSTSA